MNFSEIFVKRSVTTTLLVVVLVCFGLFAYNKLPISNLPNVSYPTLNIWVQSSGGSPQFMAESIASPLEKQLMSISGLKNVISRSSEGSTSITLQFGLSTDIDHAESQVQTAIHRANLPKLENPPVVYKDNPNDMPILVYIFSSDTLKQKELSNIINKRIEQPLTMLKGVSKVNVGDKGYAIRIKLDPDRMAAYNVTLSEVSTAVNDANRMSGGGGIISPSHNISILPKGELTTPEQYNNLIIKDISNKPVRISDIGHAFDSYNLENLSIKVSVNGKTLDAKSFAYVQVHKRTGSNIIALTTEINEKVEQIQKQLPKSVKCTLLYSPARNIISSINDVKSTLLIAFVLVLLIMYLFLGRITDTIIPGLVIPISILITFAVMYVLGFSINNLTLLGIILAIGFIVDDSIVVLENTTRHIERGTMPYEASLVSVKEITGSVVSMSLSLIIVFVPVVFMSGVIGRCFRHFALTVIIMVAASGVMSLTLTPMLCAQFLKPIALSKKSFMQRIRDNVLGWVINKYSISLRYFLKRPYISLILWIICIAGTYYFYTILPKTFIPPGDSGTIVGYIQAPFGTSSEEMNKYQTCIFNKIKSNPNFDALSITNFEEGVAQTIAIFIVHLKPLKDRQTMQKVVAELRKDVADLSYPLGNVYINAIPELNINIGGTGASGSSNSYKLTGFDRGVLDECATELAAKMKKNHNFKEIQYHSGNNTPQMNMEILRNKAYLLGLSVKQIEETLAYAFNNKSIDTFNKGSNQYNIFMQLQSKFSDSIADMSQIFLRSSITEKLIPLSSVVKLSRTVGPSRIIQYNQLSVTTISFALAPGVNLQHALKIIDNMKKDIFPVGVTGSIEGTAGQFLKTMKYMLILIGFAVFLLYILLGILYENFLHPISVLTTIPTATIGGLGFLIIFGSSLSLFAIIGVFLLLGIVVKNGIMMVDFAIQRMEEEDMDPLEAIHEASLVRFRPILMTGLTAIIGAIPIAIGIGSEATIRRPLGLMIIGGLIVAQIVTLYITPGIFIYMQKLQEKYLDKFRFTRSNKLKKLEMKKGK